MNILSSLIRLNSAAQPFSKGKDKKGTIGVPLYPTTTFSTQGKEVVAYLKFENLSGQYKLRWDWHASGGNLYYSTGNFSIKTSPNKYKREVTTWHAIVLNGDKAANTPGKWKVRILLNNELNEKL